MPALARRPAAPWPAAEYRWSRSAPAPRTASLAAFVRLGIITAGAVYYARDVLHDTWATSYILLAFSLSALAGSLVTPWCLRRTGKRRGIVIGLVATAALYVLLFFLDAHPAVFIAVFLLANLLGGFGFVAAPALVSDTVDHHETVTGRRDEGLLYAGYSFATKVGTALGGSLFAWALAWGGYRAEHVSAQAGQAIEWAYGRTCTSSRRSSSRSTTGSRICTSPGRRSSPRCVRPAGRAGCRASTRAGASPAVAATRSAASTPCYGP
ncbi:MFS transporter [Streptomyces flaveolus]|uniref:MFS transporter n=1 Tax=Streptomyces flaveolus TaxID=67297 RepID=UPI0033F32F0C